jgi:hypothetical protein
MDMVYEVCVVALTVSTHSQGRRFDGDMDASISCDYVRTYGMVWCRSKGQMNIFRASIVLQQRWNGVVWYGIKQGAYPDEINKTGEDKMGQDKMNGERPR